MAVDNPVNASTLVYCAVTDVNRYLLKSITFNTTTNPTLAQVEDMIRDAQETIDNYTKYAWRERRVSGMWHNVDPNLVYNYGAGYKFNLHRRNIRTITAGDIINVWNGTTYVDYVADKQIGRDKDYWVNYEDGYLYLKDTLRFAFQEKVIQTTFRYGEASVPQSIRKACAMLVAIALMTNEDSSFLLEEGGDTRQMGYDPRIQSMLSNVKRTLLQKAEIFVI
jgi:hypothetical protein